MRMRGTLWWSLLHMHLACAGLLGFCWAVHHFQIFQINVGATVLYTFFALRALYKGVQMQSVWGMGYGAGCHLHQMLCLTQPLVNMGGGVVWKGRIPRLILGEWRESLISGIFFMGSGNAVLGIFSNEFFVILAFFSFLYGWAKLTSLPAEIYIWCIGERYRLWPISEGYLRSQLSLYPFLCPADIEGIVFRAACRGWLTRS